MAEDHAPDATIEGTLRRLVAEITVGNYRDHHGHRLTLNTAFIDARTVLELTDLLAAGTARKAAS